MEIELKNGGKPSFRPRAKGKISLEEYLNVAESRNFNDLSVNHLNQIIAMNGFSKIHRRPKKFLIDAACALDHLMNPSRSTLAEKISPCVFVDLKDVVKDLAELQWQECCVTSIETVVSSSSSSEDAASAAQEQLVVRKRARGRSSKKQRVNAPPKFLALPAAEATTAPAGLLPEPNSASSCASVDTGGDWVAKNWGIEGNRTRNLSDILKV